MDKKLLDQTFENIKPTQAQKERMLQKILQQTEGTSQVEAKVIPIKKKKTGQWMAVAAGLILLVGVSTNLKRAEPTPGGPVMSTPMEAPSEETYFDREDLFEPNQLGERVQQIEIVSKKDNHIQATLDQAESQKVLEWMSQSEYIPFEAIDFEAIESEASKEKRLELIIKFEKPIEVNVFILPTHQIMGAGGNYYRLSQELQDFMTPFYP